MGALKYTITVESDAPPQLFLGAVIGGATVVEMRQEKVELISAAEIAQRHGISTATVRRKLAAINQGSEGKFLYVKVRKYYLNYILRFNWRKFGVNVKLSTEE